MIENQVGCTQPSQTTLDQDETKKTSSDAPSVPPSPILHRAVVGCPCSSPLMLRKPDDRHITDFEQWRGYARVANEKICCRPSLTNPLPPFHPRMT